jgi:hypothetical protein
MPEARRDAGIIHFRHADGWANRRHDVPISRPLPELSMAQAVSQRTHFCFEATVSRTEIKTPKTSRSDHQPRQRRLAGFAGASNAQGFTIHIIDDTDEVFEISASRENLEAMIVNLQHLIGSGSAENGHSRG